MIVPALWELPAAFAEDDPGALVFPAATGGPVRQGNFNKMSAWPHAVQSVGVPDRTSTTSVTPETKFAAQSGAALRDLMARMGHDSDRAAMI